MKNKVMWMVIGWVLVVGVLWTVSAYSTNIWSPIQFVKQLFVTPNGELNSSKATIKIDGTNGRIDAKSIYENGVQVATKSDLNGYSSKSYVDSKVKWLASKTDLANVKISLPTCQKGYVLTSTDGKNFKCVSLHNCNSLGGFKIQDCIADGIGKTTDWYYVVDTNIVLSGCKSQRIPDQKKCIAKIWNIYVSPWSKVNFADRVDAWDYCLSLFEGDGNNIFRELPSVSDFINIKNHENSLYRTWWNWWTSTDGSQEWYEDVYLNEFGHGAFQESIAQKFGVMCVATIGS